MEEQCIKLIRSIGIIIANIPIGVRILSDFFGIIVFICEIAIGISGNIYYEMEIGALSRCCHIISVLGKLFEAFIIFNSVIYIGNHNEFVNNVATFNGFMSIVFTILIIFQNIIFEKKSLNNSNLLLLLFILSLINRSKMLEDADIKIIALIIFFTCLNTIKWIFKKSLNIYLQKLLCHLNFIIIICIIILVTFCGNNNVNPAKENYRKIIPLTLSLYLGFLSFYFNSDLQRVDTEIIDSFA